MIILKFYGDLWKIGLNKFSRFCIWLITWGYWRIQTILNRDKRFQTTIKSLINHRFLDIIRKQTVSEIYSTITTFLAVTGYSNSQCSESTFNWWKITVKNKKKSANFWKKFREGSLLRLEARRQELFKSSRMVPNLDTLMR